MTDNDPGTTTTATARTLSHASLKSVLQQDLPASLVVFLVALPLSLGVALASGAPVVAGLIAAAVGGVVAGLLGGSKVQVSGPTASLAVVVAGAVQQTHDELAAELRQDCRRGAEELGLPVTFLCRRGDAYTELCKAADESRADLVVVGSSEQAGHRLVGSVATRLVRTGRWPVLVVP